MKNALIRLFIIFAFLLIGITHTSNSNTANAHSCSTFCKCNVTCKSKIKDCAKNACVCQSDKDTPITKQHITDEFIQHRKWIVESLWEAHLLPAMMLMTEQISAVAMHQMFAVGAMFDAKHQLETQRIIEDMQATAHKTYQPDETLCQVGTNTRSLAASDRNTDLTQYALAKTLLERGLLNGDGISGGGPRDDTRSRMAHFKKTYCDKSGFDGGMTNVCNISEPSQINRDINFIAAIDQEKTLNIDFSEAAVDTDETDVIALAHNLYGQKLFPYLQGDKLALPDGRLIRDNAFVYMDMRALMAKRSVAQAAYVAQAALKSEGTQDVKPYLTAILKEMGIPETEIDLIIGERPSYHAQMELLTKILYQTPNFYAELYGKPTNIDRKVVSMQAIGLMQRRDMYRSNLRREAIEAVWLEGALEDLEGKADNDIAQTLASNPVLDIKGLD